jgi:hypothetical protein
MTGNMVSTKSSLSTNGTNLDGFASVDPTAQDASVVLAGINDGTIQIIVKGFSAASFFGSTVHTVLEHTPWGSRTTVTTATNTLSTSNLTVSNDQVSVMVTDANGDDGYHLELTPVNGGGSGSGGSAGVAGSSGSGGNTGAAGTGAAGNGASAGSTGHGGNSGYGRSPKFTVVEGFARCQFRSRRFLSRICGAPASWTHAPKAQVHLCGTHLAALTQVVT